EHEYTRSADIRDLLVVPGLLNVETSCTGDGNANLLIFNTSGSTVTGVVAQTTESYHHVYPLSLAPGGPSPVATFPPSLNAMHVQLALGLGENTPTGQSLFSADLWIESLADECAFEGSGLVQAT